MPLPQYGQQIVRTNPVDISELTGLTISGQALDDVLMYDGSGWVNRNLSYLLQTILKANSFQWRDWYVGAGWSAAVVGTGGTNQFPDRFSISSGAGAGGTASLRSTSNPHMSVGQPSNVIDWTKVMLWVFVLSQQAGTPNGISRISIGKLSGDGVANMSRKGVGIRIDNLALKGQAHDGTSLSTVDLGVSLTATNSVKVAILSDGQGNVTWFVDADGTGLVQVGTTTGGPKVLGTANESVIQFECDNGADAAVQNMFVGSIKYGGEQ